MSPLPVSKAETKVEAKKKATNENIFIFWTKRSNRRRNEYEYRENTSASNLEITFCLSKGDQRVQDMQYEDNQKWYQFYEDIGLETERIAWRPNPQALRALYRLCDGPVRATQETALLSE